MYDDANPDVAARRAFREPWDQLSGGAPRPENWRMAVRYYSQAGVSHEDIGRGVRIAWENQHVPKSAKMAYAIGVWRKCVSAAAAQHRLNRLIDARTGAPE